MKKTGFTEEQMVSVQSVSNRWLYSLLYFCGWLAAAGAYISVMYCLIMRRVEKRGALERMASRTTWIHWRGRPRGSRS